MINKNISIWRGTQTPPTNYHLWEKEDGGLYVYLDEKWQHLVTPADKTILDEHQVQLDKIKNLALTEIDPTDTNTYKSYQLKSDNNIFGTTINIPKDKFIKQVTLGYGNATIDESTGTITIGTGLSKEYLLFSVALESGSYELVSINLTNFLTEKDYSDGLEVVDNKLKVKVDPSSEEYLKVTNAGIKVEGINDKVANAKKAGTDAQTNLTAHINNKDNPHEVTKEQVGLGNVTNEAQIPSSQKGVASGVATLGTDGKLTAAQLPAMKTVNGVSVVGSGDITIDTSLYKFVNALPTSDIDPTKIYIVPRKSGGADGPRNIYAEYVYIKGTRNQWEELGAIVVDATITPQSTNPVQGQAVINYISSTVSTIKNKVTNGTWIPVRKGRQENSIEEGGGTAIGMYTHAEGSNTRAVALGSHAEGGNTESNCDYSHAEGYYTSCGGELAEGTHVQGVANYHTTNKEVIHDVGIGRITLEDDGPNVKRLSAEVILHTTDERNGYKYLKGVGGYNGTSLDNAKSVQEVVADFETNLTNKVNKVEGKQLSTNDYTTVDKNKVAESISESAANTLINTAIGNLTKASVGLDNVDNTADANKEVLSATKLKTARTLWGRSFDGTANVSGDITDIGGGALARMNIQAIESTVDYIHMYLPETRRPLVLQKGYGNVGIGVEAPTEKLEVDGSIKLTGSVKNVTEIYTTDGSKYAEPCTEDDIKALFA